MTNAVQGSYAPLPQTISDSESDKEIDIRYLNKGNSKNGAHKSFERDTQNGYVVSSRNINAFRGKRGFAGMSLARKVCFLSSIISCFLIIVLFIWVLPCNNEVSCPFQISSWESQHDDIEMKGRINVVSGTFSNSKNLAVLFQKSFNKLDGTSGAISIFGGNGVVAWISQVKSPETLDCNLIDVNGDNVKDCLLLSEMGLQAIDPASGSVLWDLRSSDEGNYLQFPLIIPDLNGDGIKEIVSVFVGNHFHNKLVIINGKFGEILGEMYIDNCETIKGIKFNVDVIIYACINGSTHYYYEVNMSNIKSYTNNSKVQSISIPVVYNNTTNEDFTLNGHKLSVNNIGSCPNCQTFLALYDISENRELWRYSGMNTYTMKAKTFTFKPTEENLSSLRGHINGFIAKMWQWTNYSSDAETSSKHYLGRNSSVHVNTISERVILMTLNNTNIHVINASLTEVIQLCFTDGGAGTVCQPDLHNQEESLLMTDLDQDGYQELASYSSSFVKRNNDWMLTSTMKVIRLEAELPKLYESTK